MAGCCKPDRCAPPAGHPQDAPTALPHDHAHDHDHGPAHHDGQAASAPAPAAPPADGLRRSVFRIEQMDCPTEERLLRKALAPVAGIRDLSFDLIGRTLRIDHALDDDAPLVQAIRDAGMAPVPVDTRQPETARAAPAPAVTRAARWRMAAAGLFALGAEAVAYATGDETSWPIALMALAAIALSGTATLRKGWLALRHLELNINLLMSVAVIGAVVIGQWPEAAVVIWLFGIAEMIEALSLERARNAIRALTTLAPDTALVQQADGGWQEQPVAAIALDARLRVRPGERIALDGIVASGASSVDQAPITGESMPVDKREGDIVYAGTINQEGTLDYRVTHLSGQSMLDRIARSVQDAQAQRAPTQRFIDRFARVYTPAVFAIALLVAVAGPLLFGMEIRTAVYQALVLLVIACPCALVISTPVTVVSGLTAAARRGILVKGGLYLEQGRTLRAIAFDKTGTLTRGTPALTDVLPLATALDRADALHLAASLDALSAHPVARAVAQADAGRAPAAVEDFASLTGRGVQGRIDGQTYYLGNLRLARERGVDVAALESDLAALEAQGKTTIVLCRDGQALAILAVADTVRDGSRDAVAALQALGIHPVMLSGDNAQTARAVGQQVGIDDARGGMLPDDKLAALEALGARGPIGMVGDGVNDAPALARADIGFAMGAAGTDTAIETADVALMRDDLRLLPEFVRLSHRTAAILWQNIVFALGVKLLFFALTLAGLGTLWMAVFADAGASLLVVFNGLRLLRLAPPEHEPVVARG